MSPGHRSEWFLGVHLSSSSSGHGEVAMENPMWPLATTFRESLCLVRPAPKILNHLESKGSCNEASFTLGLLGLG